MRVAKAAQTEIDSLSCCSFRRLRIAQSRERASFVEGRQTPREEDMMRRAFSISAALLVAMLAMVPEMATGAERTVLGEYFNATW